ncbi:MAG: hypothetical protein J0M28_02320 [Thauera sp.]|nr:hypothetical protein [Thauera sp.]
MNIAVWRGINPSSKNMRANGKGKWNFAFGHLQTIDLDNQIVASQSNVVG